MFKNRFTLCLSLLAMISACTTGHHFTQVATNETESTNARYVASTNSGIPYPSTGTFDLGSQRGSTYVTFLKNKVKRELDRYSDVKNGGGGGWTNVGHGPFQKNSGFLYQKTLLEYMGKKWDRERKTYDTPMTEGEVEAVFDSLQKVRPKSTVDSFTYFEEWKKDKAGNHIGPKPDWCPKNDLCAAMKAINNNRMPFDLSTLYALTAGLGVKVKLDDNNYNYHVLYQTGKTNPNEEVKSGRSFASTVGRGIADASDPEYLRDLQKYLTTTADHKPFYRALMLALTNSDTSGWATLSPLGQSVASDFLTVYTAESLRHIMMNLRDGSHPWEIDLAAVTFISPVTTKSGKVVTNGLVANGDLGAWFAPSQVSNRSGIGITRDDRQKLTRAIHKFELGTPDGRDVITKIQAIIGVTANKDDVIQGVFEYLSGQQTPVSLGAKGAQLADLMAHFSEMIGVDAQEIIQSYSK